MPNKKKDDTILKTATFTHDGVQYEATLSKAGDWKGRRGFMYHMAKPDRTTRAYVWTADNVLADFASRVTGERYARHQIRYERELMKIAAAELGVDSKGARYVRTAGCSCGCSPGFVMHNDKGHNLHIVPVKSKYKADAAA